MNETGVDEDQAAPEGGGGALLRQVREAQGVHVAALAVALKVPVRQLEALEQDRLDLLPDRTFARALAASVCRHLKADPAPILARLPHGKPQTVGVADGLNEPFRASSAPGGATLWERLARPPVVVAAALLLAALTLVFVPLFDGEEPQAPAPGGMVTEPVAPAAVPSVPPTVPAASGSAGVAPAQAHSPDTVPSPQSRASAPVGAKQP